MERLRSLPIPRLDEVRSDVPLELEALIRKALARDPDRRFQTAGDLLTALETVAAHCGIPLHTVGLRDEVRTLCGEPPTPIFDGSVYSLAGEAPVPRRASGSDSEGADHQPTPPRRNRRLSSDSELAYFLDRCELSGSFDTADNR